MHLRVGQLVADVAEPFGFGQPTGSLKHPLGYVDADDAARCGGTRRLASRQSRSTPNVDDLLTGSDPPGGAKALVVSTQLNVVEVQAVGRGHRRDVVIDVGCLNSLEWHGVRSLVVSATRHSGACPFDAVVVVGSLGARAAFEEIAGQLPQCFPAPVILGLHRNDAHGLTEQLLAKRIRLPVCLAENGTVADAGTVYLTPWDRGLSFDGRQRLTLAEEGRGGRRHLFADTLLLTAAAAFGPRLIAVVLSGKLTGGAAGIIEVKRGGGRVLVQDPTTADAPSMPNAALATGCVDFALEPVMLGHALSAFCAAPGAAELFRVRMNAGVRG